MPSMPSMPVPVGLSREADLAAPATSPSGLTTPGQMALPKGESSKDKDKKDKNDENNENDENDEEDKTLESLGMASWPGCKRCRGSVTYDMESDSILCEACGTSRALPTTP